MPDAGTPIRVLIVEDSADDAALLVRELRKGGYDPAWERVETAGAMRAALKDKAWDFIFSDFMVPGFGGIEALEIAQDSGLDLPFVLVSGKVGEETLVEAMRAGATDFLVKDRLERIGSVVRREMSDAAARRGLRRARIEWRAAFDAVADPIFFHDADFRVVRANLAYAALCGISVKEVIGKHYWEVFPGLDGPLPGCSPALGTEAGHAEEFSLPGGASYLSRSFPVADDSGKYLYSVHVLQDMTERNRVREAVDTSERRFRSLIENASDLVAVVDAQGTISYISPSIVAMAGYEPAEVRGRNYLEFSHPDDFALARNGLADVLREPGKVHTSEFRFRRKGGGWVDLQSIARNALSDPAIGGIVINSRDVTERRRSEQALKLFRELVDRASDAIEVVDPESLRFLDVNAKACEDLGYSREELLSMRVLDIDTGTSATKVQALDARLRETGTATLESIHRRKDGSAFPVEVRIKRVQLDRIYMVASVRDITERKRAEVATQAHLRRTRAQAQAIAAIASSPALLNGDVEKLAAEITEQVARVAGVERANVWLFNADESELRCIDLYEATPARHSAGAVLKEAEYQSEFHALKVAPYVDADDPLTDPRTKGYVESYLKPLRITAMLDAVVKVSGRHLGLVCLEHVDTPHHWENDEIAFATQVADKVALALANRARRQSQEALERRERYFRKLIEGGTDAFFVIDRAGTVLYRSPTGRNLTGWSDDEVVGKSITNYLVPAHVPLAQSALAQTIRNPSQVTKLDLRLVRKDGTEIETEVVGRNLLADPDVGGIVVTVRDVSERKLTEEAIRASEHRFRSLFTNMLEGFAHCEMIVGADGAPDFVYVEVNPAFERLTGLKDVVGKKLSEVIPGGRETNPEVYEAYARVASGGAPERLESYVKQLNAWLSIFVYSAGASGMIAVFDNITERKQAEEALRTSRDLLGTVVEHAPVRVFWKDVNLRYLGCNSLFARDAGLARPQDLIGKDDFQMAWKDQAEIYRADDRRVIDSGTPTLGFEEPQTTPDGRTIWLRTSKVPLHGADGNVFGVLGVYEDITERKRTETELIRLGWALRALSRSNSAVVHAASEQELYANCCDAIVDSDVYPLAWIGLARDDPESSVQVVAFAGEAAAYVEGLKISWADTPYGKGPTGTAIRSGKTQLVEDFSASTDFAPWIERARAHGLTSSVSLPIRVEGAVIGALMVYGRDPGAFGPAELRLFEELAGDIGYGLLSRRTQLAYEASVLERARSAEKLRATFETAIEALAATVEQRDPYTAGHQRRVAELAVAIGRELGFDDERLTGLRVAGTIHDIGKISVPAEILARPGRIGPIEFELIKSHAQVGYDIVKGVDFPWPVADAIRQHHERLDGSGYPQGLRGEQVILEARILAVADVVEAMSSHRPYRPGLGIEAALQEIEDRRGSWFDPAVVDACVRLFHEKGFAFSPS